MQLYLLLKLLILVTCYLKSTYVHICPIFIVDKKFLTFFFKRLKKNDTGRYMDDFPFLSICGLERNFVRCDDLPLVFTEVIQKHNAESDNKEDWFSYGHANDSLMVIIQN